MKVFLTLLQKDDGNYSFFAAVGRVYLNHEKLVRKKMKEQGIDKSCRIVVTWVVPIFDWLFHPFLPFIKAKL